MNGRSLASVFNEDSNVDVVCYASKVVACLPKPTIAFIMDIALAKLTRGLSNRRDGTNAPQTLFGAFRRELREGPYFTRTQLKAMNLW